MRWPAAGFSGTLKGDSMKFEYWQSKTNNNWYWHAKASNGLIIAQGEGYVNKADCITVINIIKSQAANAAVVAI